MIPYNSIRFSSIFRWTLAVSVLIIPELVQAQWQVSVGAESPNRGSQALAFLRSIHQCADPLHVPTPGERLRIEPDQSFLCQCGEKLDGKKRIAGSFLMHQIS